MPVFPLSGIGPARKRSFLYDKRGVGLLKRISLLVVRFCYIVGIIIISSQCGFLIGCFCESVPGGAGWCRFRAGWCRFCAGWCRLVPVGAGGAVRCRNFDIFCE